MGEAINMEKNNNSIKDTLNMNKNINPVNDDARDSKIAKMGTYTTTTTPTPTSKSQSSSLFAGFSSVMTLLCYYLPCIIGLCIASSRVNPEDRPNILGYLASCCCSWCYLIYALLYPFNVVTKT